jgi:hypothetical protein
VHYKVRFSVVLGFLGLYLEDYLICMPVSRLVVALKVLLYGRWCLLVSCGVFGGNPMIAVLRAARGCWQSLCPYFFNLYIWTIVFLTPMCF